MSWFPKAFEPLKGLKRLDRHHGKPPVNVNTMPVWQMFTGTGLASTLFFSWGVAYGMLDIMNFHVKEAMNISRREAAFLGLVYYQAYIPAVFVAQACLKKFGYRPTMLLGLFVMAAGMFIMSAGAQKCSLLGMVAGHLVIGFGVGTLERSANPYAVNCGERNLYAILRLLVAQTMAGMGTVVAPYLANTFVFDANGSTLPPPPNPNKPGTCMLLESKGSSCENLGTVITFYRYLGLVVICTAVVMAFLFFGTFLMPEVAIENAPATTHKKHKFWRHPLCSFSFSRLWVGLKANWLNLGCQVAVAQFFMETMKVSACLSAKEAANRMGLAQGLFVVGRLLAAGLVFAATLTKWKALRPRFILTAFLIGATAFSLGNIWVTGSAVIACSVLIMMCEAPSFPMNFEMATVNFAAWQANAETLVILSISGGGVLPLLMGILADNVGIQKSWGLVGGSFGLVTMYPLFLNLIPSWRHAVDKAASESTEEEKEVESIEMTA